MSKQLQIEIHAKIIDGETGASDSDRGTGMITAFEPGAPIFHEELDVVLQLFRDQFGNQVLEFARKEGLLVVFPASADPVI